MAFDDYADNSSVPPKSCCLQVASENLPQSFHSLAVSEPDPITLFTPYILSVPYLSNDHATKIPSILQNLQSVDFPCKTVGNFYSEPFQAFTREKKTTSEVVYIQYSTNILRTVSLQGYLF